MRIGAESKTFDRLVEKPKRPIAYGEPLNGKEKKKLKEKRKKKKEKKRVILNLT